MLAFPSAAVTSAALFTCLSAVVAVRPSLRLDLSDRKSSGRARIHAWALSQLGDPEFWVGQAHRRLSTPPHGPPRFGANGSSSLAELGGFKTSSCEKKSPKSPGKKLWEDFGAVACRKTDNILGIYEKSYAQCPAGLQCFVYQLFAGSQLPVPQPCSSGDSVSTMTSPFDKKDACKEGDCVWFRLKDCTKDGNVACKCLDAQEYLDQKQEELDELTAQMVATVVVSENLPGFTSQGGGMSFQDDVNGLTKEFKDNQAQLQAAKLTIAKLSTQNAKACKTADLAKCQEWTSDGPSDPYVAKCTIHQDHGNERPFCHCKPSTTCFVNCVSKDCTPAPMQDRGRVASPKQPIKIPCHEAMHAVRTIDPSGGGGGGNSTTSAVAFKLGTCEKSKYGHESCECLSPSIAKSLLMAGNVVAGSKVVDKCDSVRAVLGLGSKGSQQSICMDLSEIVACMPAAGAMQSIGTMVSKGATAVGDATGSVGLKYVGNEVASLVSGVLSLGGSVLKAVDRGLGALAAPLDGRYWDAGLVRGLSRQGLGAAVEAKLESEQYLQGLLRQILTAFVLQPFMPRSLFKLTNTTKDLMARHTSGDLDAAGEEALASAIQQLRTLTSDMSAAADLMQEPLLLASGAVEAPQPGTFCTSSSNKQFKYLNKEVKWERLESFLSYGLALSAKQVGFMVDAMTGEPGAPVWAGPVYSIGDTDLVLSLKLEMIMGLEELVVQSSNCEGDLLNKGMYCDLALVPGVKPLVVRGLNAKIICKKQNCLETSSDVWSPEEATSFLDNQALILLPSVRSGKQRLRFIPGKATFPARQELLQSEYKKKGAVDADLRQKLEEATAFEKEILDAMARRRINPGEYEIEELGLCDVDEEGEAQCEPAEPNIPVTSPDFGKPQHQQARILESFNRNHGTEDAPGEYVITQVATATGSAALGGEVVQERIEPGAVVSVVEVVAEGKRIRGRISSPAGWISLEDTDCVEPPCRWAEKVVSAARVIRAFAGVAGGYGKLTMKLKQTHRWMGQYTIKGRDMKSRVKRKDGDWFLDCDDALVATLAEQGVEITPGIYPVLQMIYLPTAGVRLAQVLSLDESLLTDIGEAQHAYLLDLGDSCMCDGGEILKSQVGSSGAKWFERLTGWLGHGAEEKEKQEDDAEPEECKKTVLDQELNIELKNIIVRARVWLRRTYSVAHASDLHPSKTAVNWAHKRISQKAKKFKWWLREAVVSSPAEKSGGDLDLLQRRAQEMLQRSWVKGVQMNRVTVWEDQALSPTLRLLGAVVLGRCVHRIGTDSSGCVMRASPTWCNSGSCEWSTTSDAGTSLKPERIVTLALPGSKVVRLRSSLTTLYAATKGCECAAGRPHKYSSDISQGFCHKRDGDESAWCATVGSCGITGSLTTWGQWSKCDEAQLNGMSPSYDVVSTSPGTGFEVGDYVTDDVVGLLAKYALENGRAPMAVKYVAAGGKVREAKFKEVDSAQTEVALSLHFWSAGGSSNGSALHEVSASREAHRLLLRAGWPELTAAGASVNASEEPDVEALAAAAQNLEYRIAKIDEARTVAAGLEKLKASQAVAFSMSEADIARARVVNVENEVDRIGAGKPTLLNFKLSGESCLRREVAHDVECNWYVGKCVPDSKLGATKQQCGMIDLDPAGKGGLTPVYYKETCHEASLRAGGPGFCVWELEWNRKCLKIGVSNLKLEPLSNDFIAVRPVTEKREGRCKLDAMNSVVGSTIGLLQRFKAVEWLAGKALVDPVISIAYADGPWGGPDALRWLEESAADGALVCAECRKKTRTVDEPSVLDLEICKTNDHQGTHRRFRMDINPREIEVTRSLLSTGISELRQGEMWRGMLGKATNSTRLIMDLGVWWAAPASELARLQKEEAAREKGLVERLIFQGLGQKKAEYITSLARGASHLSQLEDLGDQPYLIKAVKLRDSKGEAAWPSSSIEHRAAVPAKKLLGALKRSALGDLRLALGAKLPSTSSGEVPAGAALTAVRRADRVAVIWGDASSGEGTQDDIDALAKLIKSKGLQDSDTVEATFSSTPSLEEWLASTAGGPEDQKLSLLLVGGCECAAGWSGKRCHLQLPSQVNQMVVDEVDVEGLVTLASRGTGQNCIVQEAGAAVVCNSHLAAELMRHGKCTDMVGALKGGEEGIVKGVFKLERPASPDQCPSGNCSVVCSGSDCLGELAYIKLLSTGRYCRLKVDAAQQHALTCDLEDRPWRCGSRDASSGSSSGEVCAGLQSKDLCSAEPACLVEAMPFVLRGNLDAFKDQAFWKDTFKVVLGGAGAAALVFVGAFFPPVGAATYLLLLGALGGAGAYGGMKVGGSVDAKLGGGAQGLLWSIGRQMKGVRKSLYSTLDWSLESLYEIDERSFGGLGDVIAR